MICRGVVTFINPKTLWGRLVYAPTEDSDSVIDALSAALIVKEAKTARGIRLDGVAKTRTIIELKFHTTSWHGQPSYGRGGDWLPHPGEIIEVHLNDDYKLVAVWNAEHATRQRRMTNE